MYCNCCCCQRQRLAPGLGARGQRCLTGLSGPRFLFEKPCHVPLSRGLPTSSLICAFKNVSVLPHSCKECLLNIFAYLTLVSLGVNLPKAGRPKVLVGSSRLPHGEALLCSSFVRRLLLPFSVLATLNCCHPVAAVFACLPLQQRVFFFSFWTGLLCTFMAT